MIMPVTINNDPVNITRHKIVPYESPRKTTTWAGSWSLFPLT